MVRVKGYKRGQVVPIYEWLKQQGYSPSSDWRKAGFVHITKSAKCKNCGHNIVRKSSGWKHCGKSMWTEKSFSKKCLVGHWYSYCGCLKPEPK